MCPCECLWDAALECRLGVSGLLLFWLSMLRVCAVRLAWGLRLSFFWFVLGGFLGVLSPYGCLYRVIHGCVLWCIWGCVPAVGVARLVFVLELVIYFNDLLSVS